MCASDERNDRDESAAGRSGAPDDPDGLPLEELLAALAAGVSPRREAAAPPSEQDERSVVFRLGSTRCALPIDRVFEIAEVPKITAVPNLPFWVRGVANLRGDILAVIDLRAFVGLTPFPRGGRGGRLLVVRAAPGPLGQVAAGLWVDEVEGVAPVARGELAPPDGSIDDRLAHWVAGVLTRDGRPLAAFDLDRFFATPEIRGLNAELVS
ncbi:MAG TPA: chemotaxis protein CheW [Thermoanaerobaculia bacterium]|jgi:chemotaxis signal transduction protein|nr:chemotaxis protein CheW [Thermoanaerobaculia bacterium]